MSGNQVGNGKAFEYCCLIAVKKAAIKRGIKTSISPDDKNYSYAESLFVRFSAGEQKALMLGAEAAVSFIFSCEPYMKDNVLATELRLSMQSDAAGQKGDVRDIIFLRWSSFGSGKKEWECPASIIMKPSNIHELVSQGKAIFSPTGLKTNLVAQINSGSLLG